MTDIRQTTKKITFSKMPERQQEKLLANLDKVKVYFNLPKKKKIPFMDGES